MPRDIKKKHLSHDAALPAQTFRTQPFLSDEPITSSNQDLLRRDPFVDRVARGIYQWRGHASTVIALNGAWGGGKTSIKELIVARLREWKDPPHILEFEPWQWSGTDQLMTLFLDELGKEFRKALPKGKREQAGIMWGVASAGLTGLKALAQGVKPLAAAHGVDPASVETLGAGFAASAELAKGARDVAVGDAGRASMYEYKQELQKLFQGLKRPILMVIDDIDRLTPDEMRQIMQMVKANADFPNVIYLLLFQRETVEKGLTANLNVNGREFLEKIVQVSLDVPMVTTEQLSSIFDARWKELFERDLYRLFFGYRWSVVKELGLLPLLTTVRDINRYFSSLRFQVEGLTTQHAIEVNPVDLCALEALRVFEPNVYEALARNRALLLGHTVEFLLSDERAKAKREVDANGIIDKAKEENRPYVRYLLAYLFPSIGHSLGVAVKTDGDLLDNNHEQARRVCAPTMFHRYFIFGPAEGDVSQTQIVQLLVNNVSTSDFVSEFEAFLAQDRLLTLLRRLATNVSLIRSDQTESISLALFQVCDNLDDRMRNFEFRYDQVVVQILLELLARDQKAAADTLIQIIQKTDALYLPGLIILHVLDRMSQVGQWSYTSTNPWRYEALGTAAASIVSGWENLKEVVADKISGTDQDRLTIQRQLYFLLSWWRDWKDKDAPAKWAQGLIVSDSGLLIFLRSFGPFYHYSLEERGLLTALCPLPELLNRVASLDREALSQEDAALVRSFLTAVEAWSFLQ